MTQDKLDYLIVCPKFISVAPRRKHKANGVHEENELQAMSFDHAHRFRVFIRRSLILPESFSIGLVYKAQDTFGEIRLIRCNGDHGGHRNPDKTAIVGPHVHRAKAELLEQGLVADRYAEMTREYASLEEAIYYFFRYTNVDDWEQYFPEAFQWGLFTDGDS